MTSPWVWVPLWLEFSFRWGLQLGFGFSLGLGFGCGFRFRLGLKTCERFAGDFDNRFAIFIAQLVGGFESRAHLCRDLRRRLVHGVLGVRHPVERHVVEEVRGQRQQDGDLGGYGHRGEFRLFEAGADSPSMLDDLAGVFIQARSEPGKGFEFLELRVGELKVARDGAVDRPLRFTADARNGFSDIDRGQHTQFKQRRRKIDLPVGDGNQVGRNVGGNVLRLGFDDG